MRIYSNKLDDLVLVNHPKLSIHNKSDQGVTKENNVDVVDH